MKWLVMTALVAWLAFCMYTMLSYPVVYHDQTGSCVTVDDPNYTCDELPRRYHWR